MVQSSLIPVMIMCYKRVDELEKVVNSLRQLNISKYYFHLHSAPDEEGQKQVMKVFEYINSLDLNKEVIYKNEPLGCRKAFFSALKHISKQEDKFLFIEDDIVINPDSESVLRSEMESLKGILKFGPAADNQGIFWGWALTKRVSNTILNTDIKSLTYNESSHMWNNEIHYKGFLELLSRNKTQPWDDEVGQIIKLHHIPVKVIPSIVTNIGEVSTRVGGIPDGDIKGNNYVTFVNGKLIN